MKLEDQVCSLELAKKLKELGVKQESYWYWHFYSMLSDTNPPSWQLVSCVTDKKDKYSAFTVAELGEILPKWIKKEKLHYCLTMDWFGNGVNVNYENRNKVVEIVEKAEGKEYSNILHTVCDESEANARAKMLIYLIENKLLISKEGR